MVTNRQELIEAIAHRQDPRAKDVAPGLNVKVPYKEVYEFIKAEAARRHGFPEKPEQPMGVFLVENKGSWIVEWYVSTGGGSMPPAKYTEEFASLQEGFDEVIKGYFPAPKRIAKRIGVAKVLPD